jgi:hypothetical protein
MNLIPIKNYIENAKIRIIQHNPTKVKYLYDKSLNL